MNIEKTKKEFMKLSIAFLFFIMIPSFSSACVINWNPQTGTYQVDANGKVR